MKKKDFVTLMMSVVGGILFALGMCMALLPEWNAMTQGVVIGAVGLAVLLVMLLSGVVLGGFIGMLTANVSGLNWLASLPSYSAEKLLRLHCLVSFPPSYSALECA